RLGNFQCCPVDLPFWKRGFSRRDRLFLWFVANLPVNTLAKKLQVKDRLDVVVAESQPTCLLALGLICVCGYRRYWNVRIDVPNSREQRESIQFGHNKIQQYQVDRAAVKTPNEIARVTVGDYVVGAFEYDHEQIQRFSGIIDNCYSGHIDFQSTSVVIPGGFGCRGHRP